MKFKTSLFSLMFAGAVLFAVPAFAADSVLQSSVSTYCGGQYTAPVKFAVINQGAADATVVAAVTGKKIRVLSYVVTADTADTLVLFESGTGGTAITGDMRFPDNGILSQNCGPYGCFETAAGALLNIQSTTGSIDGHLTYVECE